MISNLAHFGVPGELVKMKLACLGTVDSASDTASTSCDASDYGRPDDCDEDDDEVLSVGCESPPPPLAVTLPQVHSLKFSIDNILRPEFGGVKTVGRKCSDSAKCSPIDLSSGGGGGGTQGSEGTPAASGTGSGSQQPNILWPAWVYCTRYSDRPSSGEYQQLFCNQYLYFMTKYLAKPTN